MTLPTILTYLTGPTVWLLKFFFLSGWSLAKFLLWLTSPAWLLAAIVGAVLSLFGGPADAGWFSWGPDPKTEAANQALQRAAQIAADAANIQARQHGQILEAVTALSNERTNLAQQLMHLGQLAAKDAAWAAALQGFGPVLIAVAVLALGCAAIWMTTRASDTDSQLATVLVDEITGTGSATLLAASGRRNLMTGSTEESVQHSGPNLIDIKPGQPSPPDIDPQEMPF